ncbi:MAG: hypothetical protein QM675_01805 [Protaetiibacter sp.]
MLRKFLATFVAVLLALGLSLVTTAPASALSSARSGGNNGGSTQPTTTQPTTTQPTTTTLYGVALYVYKKIDASKSPSWENSGPQRLVVQDVDNTSKDANGWFTSLDPAQLPSDVCGPGWAVQQDKATMSASFTTFPSTITPPTDNIGWPPIYAAKHENLESYVTVPACPSASAELVFTDASCSAPATVALGAISHATWGTLSRTSGPGEYSVTATADSGYTFADGSTVSTLSGSLDGVLSASDSRCAQPATCIPTSSVSYSYDATTNSGVITVPEVKGSTGKLCSPFWVTAASWKYLGTSTWAQKLDVVQKLGPIETSGEYEYEAPVTCGQGDIYASFDADAATLSPTTYLYGPNNPFQEHFLHDMGFTGPNPTYTTTALGCNELSVEPTATDPSCWEQASYTLTDTEHVTWYVNGTQTAPGSYAAETGSTVSILAVAELGWTLTGGTQDPETHQWSRSWTFEFGTPSCTEVTPEVTEVQEDCSTLGSASYTLPLIEGVIWRVSSDAEDDSTGEIVPAGTYTVTTPATVQVTAELADPTGSIVFAPDAQTSWTLTFTALDSTSCDPQTLAVFPTAATLAEQCTAAGGIGVLTLGQVDGVSFFEDVNYTVDGVLVTSSTIQLAPGTHTVQASTKNATDGLDGDTEWTFVVSDGECDLATYGLFPTNVELSQQCATDGGIGVLTLGQVDGVSFFEDVNYFIDGVAVTSSTVELAPGTYEVTVTTKNPDDGLDGPIAWTVVVTDDAVCGELETLALTGFDPNDLLAFAGVLVALGAAIAVTGRVRLRRPE